MTLNKVDLRSAKNTLADLAYQEILRAILAHELRPGDRLNPLELAQRMGISPTPVKHSLARLAGEGLVEFKSGLGPFLVAPSDRDIADLFDARLMCELYCVQQGIGNVDDRFLATAHEHLRHCEEAFANLDEGSASRMAFARADSGFHLHLVSLWPNQKTQTWYRQLNVHIRAGLLRETLGEGTPFARMRAALAAHRDVVAALERRDAATCAEVLRRHVIATKEAMLALRREMVGVAR